MPRARAASSSAPLAYPLSAACSPGSRPRASSVSCTGSVISTSVTGAGVVSVLVIRFGAGRRPAASGSWQVCQMCTLYPAPALAAFFGVPHIQVIRRDQPGSGRREALLVPPPDHLLPARAGVQAELLDPDPAQRLHRGQVPQPARRILVAGLPQQVVAVLAVPHRQVRALGLAVRQPEVIDPLPVDLLPGRADHPGQPARRRGRQRLQRRPDTLPGQHPAGSAPGSAPAHGQYRSAAASPPRPGRARPAGPAAPPAAPPPSRRPPAGTGTRSAR